MFSCEEASTNRTVPLYSFRFTSLSASRINISFPSSFFVVTSTTGFFDLRRLFRIWALVSTCFSSVRFGTKLTWNENHIDYLLIKQMFFLTSKTQMNPSTETFPSGISLWSNSFSIPARKNNFVNKCFTFMLYFKNIFCINLFIHLSTSLFDKRLLYEQIISIIKGFKNSHRVVFSSFQFMFILT